MPTATSCHRLWLCILFFCLSLAVCAEPLLNERAGQYPVRGWVTPWPAQVGKTHLKVEVQPAPGGAELRPEDTVSVLLDMPGPGRMKPVSATLQRSAGHTFEADATLTMAGLWRAIWVVTTPTGEFRMVSTFQVGGTGGPTTPARTEELCAPAGAGELPPVRLEWHAAERKLQFTAPPGKWRKVAVAAQMSGMPMSVAPQEARALSGGRYEADLPVPMAGLWLVRVDCDGNVTPPMELVVQAPPSGGRSRPLLLLVLCVAAPLVVWRKRAWIPSVAVVASTLIAGQIIEKYWPPADHTAMDMAAPNAAVQAPTPVLQAVVQRLRLSVDKEFTATVQPASERVLTSSVGGVLSELVPVGTRVEAGQVVARVGERPLHASARMVVFRHFAEVGTLVPAGSALLSLVDVSQVRVRAAVPLADAERVGRGQPVEIYGADMLGRGKISAVSATADNQTFWADALVDNRVPPGAMSMGMGGSVAPPRKADDDGGRPGRFALGQEVVMRCVVAQLPGVLCVPLEAIREMEGKQFVFVVRPVAGQTVVDMREVTIGLRNRTHGEVVSGLSEGEKVVATTQEPLRDGVLVTEGYWGAGAYRKLLLPDPPGHAP
jgi:multidrug efflux pump subunit AcrA (membrane-fusion protein)